MIRLRGLLAAVLGLWLAACGARDPGIVDVDEAIELGDYLSVADIEGRIEPLVGADSGSAAGFRMASGSRLVLHFLLPDGPSLVGEASSEAAARGGGSGRIHVVVTADGGLPPLEIEGPSQATKVTAPPRFREDLSAFSGRMVRLDIACAGAATEAGACGWRSLRIEGTRAKPAASRTPRDRYNVFLILLDSLRQDHIEPYGGSGVKTPHLARFAESGVTFENARSNSSWTRPAVAAMLTSLYPPDHGVRTMDDVLSSSFPYLPEILQQSGYRTIAVVNNPNTAGDLGFSRGFDRLVDFWNSDKQALKYPDDPEGQAKFVWSHYIKATVRGAEPFFVYLHELDPHSPYDPPEPYRSQYGFDYRGTMGTTMQDLGAMREFPDRVTPDDIRYINSRYKGEVAFMDRYVGWILDRLSNVPLKRPTLIVFVSDHGEEFWEHQSVGHGETVYEELLRVPLVMQLDGILPAGLRIRADVTLADLSPTVLDLLGIEAPASMQGESLLPLVDAPDGRVDPRPVFARGNEAPAEESISLGRWKLIRNLRRAPSAVALFDLERDPGETRDRASEHPIVAATLAQRLAWKFDREPSDSAAANSPVTPYEADPDARRRLKELGYIE